VNTLRLRHNRPLAIAIACSVLAHAGLLALRFAAPDAFRLRPADPGLEVILVNAKHARAPLKAEALAQANLDGGGNAEAGRAQSPLPDLRKVENGDSIKALQRRIADLEQQQKNILTRTRPSAFNTAPTSGQARPDPQRGGADEADSTSAIARMTAEITQRISDENKRPRKTFISPSTREAGYAMYYKAMQKRVEETGTLNFPQQGGSKLYGELVVYIPIFQDGSIYEKEGGPRIERGSGNPALDRAAPFGKFPANMRSTDKDDLWIVITRFRFTREEKLQAELRGDGA
jgi:periplasmic protein TonB